MFLPLAVSIGLLFVAIVRGCGEVLQGEYPSNVLRFSSRLEALSV